MGNDEQANRLDALLSHHKLPSPDDQALAPLVTTAATLERMADVQPKPAFAQALETRLKREAVTMSQQPRRRVITHHSRLFWQLAAAAVLLLVCSSVAISALASPGSPLYGLHRLEQNVRVKLAQDAASRAHLQLTYAQESLTALENTLRQQDHSAYSDMLANFLSAYAEASSAVDQVPAGDQHDTLETALNALQTRATNDLRQALPGMNWTDRLATTKALDTLGNAVPRIRLVTYTHTIPDPGGPGTGEILLLQIHGSGFASGATVLINGQPAGDVRRITQNDIQVMIHGMATLAPGTAIGVSNPDGTAVETTSVSRGPQQAPTTTPDNHGGHRSGT